LAARVKEAAAADGPDAARHHGRTPVGGHGLKNEKKKILKI
jgi:hypothetical protein